MKKHHMSIRNPQLDCDRQRHLSGRSSEQGNPRMSSDDILTRPRDCLPLLPQSSTRETPYRLTYETDAMISVEIDEPSPRRDFFNPFENPFSLRVDLDLVLEHVGTTPRFDLATSTKMTLYGRGPETQGRKRKIGS
ncbi:hypothetical protein CR513_42920, partial [Mucuna pruriens]